MLSSLAHKLSFGRLKVGWYSNSFVSDDHAIFAGGCPRSGTTLLYSLLNAHPNIAVGLETGLLSGNRKLKGISNRTNIPIKEIKKIYHRSKCYPQFTQAILRELCARESKPRWGEKSPGNVIFIENIFKFFPNAKFIHLIRDGRDAACSLHAYPATFGFKYDQVPWDVCVERWYSWTSAGMQHRDDPRYREIQYEELVDEPESVLRGLFEWLGEPWEGEILNAARSEKVSTHPGIGQPITRSSTARWRTNLPPEARELFGDKENELLVKLGYIQDFAWKGEY